MSLPAVVAFSNKNRVLGDHPALCWIEVRVVALTNSAASLSFSPSIDLIKHDDQHNTMSLIRFFPPTLSLLDFQKYFQ